MKQLINKYGTFNQITFCPEYVDWDGNEVKRTPMEYPYSYEPHVIAKIDHNYQGAVYSDRLYQWDYEKYNRLCQKHFNDEAQSWDHRPFDKIEEFLADYFNNQNLKLVGIMKGANYSNGYPYWIFMYNER